MKTSCVIWDYNGTLLNDVAACFFCVNTLLVRHGHAPFPDLGAYRRTFGFPIRDYYRKAGFDFSVTPYDALAVEFMAMYDAAEPDIPLSDGVVETLAEIRARGIRQIVLSAAKESDLRKQIEKRGIGGYFDEILGISDIYAASKLHIARDWLRTTPHPPASMLLIGDTLHDAETAHELGCRCVLFRGGHQALGDYDGAVIDRIENFLDFLK